MTCKKLTMIVTVKGWRLWRPRKSERSVSLNLPLTRNIIELKLQETYSDSNSERTEPLEAPKV